MQGTRLDQGQGLIASYLSSVLFYFAYILLQGMNPAAAELFYPLSWVAHQDNNSRLSEAAK